MKAHGGMDVLSQIFLTSALVGCEWSASRPGRFTHEERAPVPIEYEAGWAPEPIWTTLRIENSLPYRDSNSDPSVVQPVASRYTDYNYSMYMEKYGDFRPKKTWRRSIMEEAQREGRIWKEMKRLAADRSRWKSFVEALCSYTGDNRK
jgi:hypothetical protein